MTGIGEDFRESAKAMEAYKVGDRDERPWGEYEVTGVGTAGGEEFCEKKITVNPGQVLSLQSHNLRREYWRVESGVLTVVLDDSVRIIAPGQSISIPQGALHAMANAGSAPVVVYEKQQGICREEDIVRYLDAYGRGTVAADDPKIAASVAVYRDVMNKVTGAVSPPKGKPTR